MTSAKTLAIKPSQAVTGYQIILPQELAATLMQPVKGAGGWQTLLKSIQALITSLEVEGVTIHSLNVTPSLLKVLAAYGVKFGAGGYQGRIRWILSLLVQQYIGVFSGETEAQ